MRARNCKPASVSVTARVVRDEQRNADFALQRRDRPGCGRLRNVQLTTSRGKNFPLVGDPSEQPQRKQASRS